MIFRKLMLSNIKMAVCAVLKNLNSIYIRPKNSKIVISEIFFLPFHTTENCPQSSYRDAG